MSLPRPQRPAVDPAQRRGAVAQCLPKRGLPQRGLPGWGLAVGVRPGLGQRVGGGERGWFAVRGRQVGADRGLHAPVDPHRADRTRRVQADQAGPGQVGDRSPDKFLIGPVGGTGPAGDVAAGRRAGQHGRGDPVGIEQGGQRQGRPGQPRGRQPVGALGGQRPGGQHGRRDPGHRHAGHVLAPLGELRPVLPAAQPAQLHHGRRLGQAERQAVEVLAQVQRLEPLLGIAGQPGAEVGQGLARAEPAHGRDPQVRRPCPQHPQAARRSPAARRSKAARRVHRGRVGQRVKPVTGKPRGDHDLAGRPRGP